MLTHNEFDKWMLINLLFVKVLPEHEHLGDNNDDYYDEYEDIFIDGMKLLGLLDDFYHKIIFKKT